jgi:hypothetical protein
VSTINEIMFSPVNQPPKLAARWGLLVDRYTDRILFFRKGIQMAHYDGDLVTYIVAGDLPSAMTRQNCQDYRYSQGKIVHQPHSDKGRDLKAKHYDEIGLLL